LLNLRRHSDRGARDAVHVRLDWEPKRHLDFGFVTTVS
jgi:hypothetical protein